MTEPNQEAFDLYAHGVNFCQQHEIPLSFLRVVVFTGDARFNGTMKRCKQFFNGKTWADVWNFNAPMRHLGSLYLEAPYDDLVDFVNRSQVEMGYAPIRYHANWGGESGSLLFAIDKGHVWVEQRHWRTATDHDRVNSRMYIQVDCVRCGITVQVLAATRFEADPDLVRYELNTAFTPVCKVPNDKK